MAFEQLLQASQGWIQAAQEKKRREQEKEQFEKKFSLAKEEQEYQKPIWEQQAKEGEIKNKLYSLQYDEAAKKANYMNFDGIFVPAYKKEDGSLDTEKIYSEYQNMIKLKNTIIQKYYTYGQGGGSGSNGQANIGGANGLIEWLNETITKHVEGSNVANKDVLLNLIKNNQFQELIKQGNSKEYTEFLTSQVYMSLYPLVQQGVISQADYNQFVEMVKTMYGIDLNNAIKQLQSNNPVFNIYQVGQPQTQQKNQPQPTQQNTQPPNTQQVPLYTKLPTSQEIAKGKVDWANFKNWDELMKNINNYDFFTKLIILSNYKKYYKKAV